MYTFNPERRKELSFQLMNILTEEEKQLLYEACKSMANELSFSSRRYEDILKPSNSLTEKAGVLYELAQTLADSMLEESV